MLKLGRYTLSSNTLTIRGHLFQVLPIERYLILIVVTFPCFAVRVKECRIINDVKSVLLVTIWKGQLLTRDFSNINASFKKILKHQM